MRTRNQKGWIEVTKSGTFKGHWTQYVRNAETGEERRSHHSRILGHKKTTRKFEATAELAKIVAPLNATQTSRRDNRVSLRWFCEHRWQPTVEGNWGPTTAKTNLYFLNAILAQFGNTPLRELDKVELQNWINGLAQRYSRSMVNHCFTYLRSMCAEAVEQEFLAKDPARKLKRPKTRKPDETRLEWPQYKAIIDAAPTQRDKLAIKVVAGTAVRPGELFAFRWRSLKELPNHRRALRVTETVYKSEIRAWAKTEESEGFVPLPDRLATELMEWKKESKGQKDDDFIFPNSVGGFMDYENFEARVLEPICKKLGLAKLNFQVLRRSFATLAYGERKGTLKDVQKQLRHTSPDTTLENYVKEIPESVYVMLDLMYAGITGTSEKPSLVSVQALGGVQ